MHRFTSRTPRFDSPRGKELYGRPGTPAGSTAPICRNRAPGNRRIFGDRRIIIPAHRSFRRSIFGDRKGLPAGEHARGEPVMRKIKMKWRDYLLQILKSSLRHLKKKKTFALVLFVHNISRIDIKYIIDPFFCTAT